MKKFLDRAKKALDAAVFKKAARTFLYAFLATTLVGYLGWLNEVTAWATSSGQAPFPDASNLTYITVSGFTAGIIGLVNGIGLWLENMTGHAVLRDVPPINPPRAEGGIDHRDPGDGHLPT